GPHPYPTMVRDFQSVIGREVREQLQEAEGRLPDTLVACIGGGSNAMGLFHPFLDDPGVAMVGPEAGGDGIETGRPAASLAGRRQPPATAAGSPAASPASPPRDAAGWSPSSPPAIPTPRQPAPCCAGCRRPAPT